MAKAKKSFIQERKKELIVIGIILLIIVGVSFAWLTQTLNGTKENVIVSGNLKLTLSNESPIIKLGGTYGYGEPMTDAMGLTQAPYTFTVTNTGTEDAYFSLYLDDVNSYDVGSSTVYVTTGENGNRMSDSDVKFQIKTQGTTCNTATTLSVLESPRRLGTTDCETTYPISDNYAGNHLAAGASRTYELRVWINSAATNSVVGKVFAAKLRIEATQNDATTNGALSDFTYY